MGIFICVLFHFFCVVRGRLLELFCVTLALPIEKNLSSRKPRPPTPWVGGGLHSSQKRYHMPAAVIIEQRPSAKVGHALPAAESRNCMEIAVFVQKLHHLSGPESV